LEVVKERSGDVLHLKVSGRLDNYWSEPFDEALEEMIRDGALHLRLDLSEVQYISSAGVGVLMKVYRETTGLQRSFQISAASERVEKVLRLSALDDLLFGAPIDLAPKAKEAAPPKIESEGAVFECHALGGRRSACSLSGDPARLPHTSYTAEDVSEIAVRKDVFGLGVGALGSSYEECRDLFGEFVAAAGSAAFMPTDGTTTPDYMVSAGELVPEIQALYAITFRGAPSHLLRFEAKTPGGDVSFSEIVRTCATLAETPEFGMVMAAEVSGLVCARLRRSPAASDGARFEFPAVRQWLWFTPEREYDRSSCIVVGLASASPSEAMGPFLRPVTDALRGHFHAAVTAFRSLPRGKIEIADALAQALQPRSVLSVVHLLRDSRPIEGAGESEFHRGACWIFPMAGGAAS
jgi:anti-sigma B factor antagonist